MLGENDRNMPDADEIQTGTQPTVDGGERKPVKGLVIALSLLVFLFRGYVSGSGPVIMAVAVLCAFAVYSCSWLSVGFLVAAWVTVDFSCTLGPGSNPCEPLNVPGILAVLGAGAALIAWEVWRRTRRLPRH